MDDEIEFLEIDPSFSGHLRFEPDVILSEPSDQFLQVGDTSKPGSFAPLRGIEMVYGPLKPRQDEASLGFISTDDMNPTEPLERDAVFILPQASGIETAIQDAEAALKSVLDTTQAVRKEGKHLQDTNAKIKREIDELKKIIKEKEAENLAQGGGAINTSAISAAQKMKRLDEIKRRQEAKKRALEAGVDFVDDDVNAHNEDGAKERGSLSSALFVISNRIGRFFRIFDVMQSSVEHAESLFGSGIAVYFKFFRWMILNALFQAVLWGGVVVYNAYLSVSAGKTFRFISSLYPAWFVFSGFEGSLLYALVFLCCILYIAMSSLLRFVSEYRAKFVVELSERDQNASRYAANVFSGVDFGVNTEQRAADISAAVASKLKELFSEDTIRQRVKARTQSEKLALYGRRAGGLLLNMVLIGAGWVGIVYSTFVFSSNTTSFVMSLIPTITPTAINALLPQITALAVSIERWDDPALALKMRVGRLYLGKILSALVQAAIVFMFIEVVPSGLFNIQKRDCDFDFCEDQVGAKFFQLFAIDVIIGIASNFLINALRFVVFAKILKKPASAKVEFDVPPFVIKVLYQQLLLWFALPYFPISSLLGVALFFISFLVDYLVLKLFNEKPQKPWSAKDLGSFFMIVYTATMAMALVAYYYTFFVVPCPFFQPPDTSRCTRQGKITNVASPVPKRARPEAARRVPSHPIRSMYF